LELAQLLTSAHFRDVACIPLLDNPISYRCVAKEFVHAIGSPGARELWRGIARVWSVLDALSNKLREVELLAGQPDDTEFKLLRHSSLLLPQKALGVGRDTYSQPRGKILKCQQF
jgi:hypothetical protein